MNTRLIIGAVIGVMTMALPRAYAAAPGTTAGQASNSAETTMTALFGDPVVATGAGVQIKQSALDEVMVGIKSAAVQRGQTLTPDQLNLIEAKMLEQLIDIQLLLAKATDEDKTAGAKKADSQMALLLQRAGSEKTLGLQLKGTLGLLLDAKRAGLVTTVAPVLDQLVALGFRVSRHTRAAVLGLAGETP